MPDVLPDPQQPGRNHFRHMIHLLHGDPMVGKILHILLHGDLPPRIFHLTTVRIYHHMLIADSFDQFQIVLKFDFILTSPNTVLRTITEDLFAEHHLTIRSNYNSLSLDFALAMVEQNLGLLFIHESLVKANERVMRLSIGKKRLWRDLVIAYPTQQYRSKATRAFAAEIHQALDMTY